MFETIGGLPETLDWREIGGWEYVRLVPPGRADRPAPPAWLFWLVARLSPYMRSRVRAAVEFIRTDAIGRLLQTWHEEWQPKLATRIVEMRKTALAELSDGMLDRELEAAIDLLHEGFRVHFLLHGAIGVPLAELAFACRDLLGWSEHRAFELVNGLSAKSTEPSQKLAEIAAVVSARPATRCLLDAINERTSDRLAGADPDVARLLAAYLQEYGCRCLPYEVADPTLAEQPTLVLALLRDQVARGFRPQATTGTLERNRTAALDEARAALADRPEAWERFRRLVDRARVAYPVREDNEFFTVSAPLALVRYRIMELGRRLVARGQIDEARRGSASGEDLRPLVRRRKRERAWVDADPGPGAYGTPQGPPPSFGVLPKEARLVNNAILWNVERVFEAARSAVHQQAAGGVLRGIAASAGRYSGRVRVIHGEWEFDKLRAGDVLVCPITSPVWSVIVPSVGAIVTDTGGVLSHSAIIAREYAVPAVVATGNATGLLRDDQIVTVDGTAGMVRIG